MNIRSRIFNYLGNSILLLFLSIVVGEQVIIHNCTQCTLADCVYNVVNDTLIFNRCICNSWQCGDDCSKSNISNSELKICYKEKLFLCQYDNSVLAKYGGFMCMVLTCICGAITIFTIASTIYLIIKRNRRLAENIELIADEHPLLARDFEPCDAIISLINKEDKHKLCNIVTVLVAPIGFIVTFSIMIATMIIIYKQGDNLTDGFSCM